MSELLLHSNEARQSTPKIGLCDRPQRSVIFGPGLKFISNSKCLDFWYFLSLLSNQNGVLSLFYFSFFIKIQPNLWKVRMSAKMEDSRSEITTGSAPVVMDIKDMIVVRKVMDRALRPIIFAKNPWSFKNGWRLMTFQTFLTDILFLYTRVARSSLLSWMNLMDIFDLINFLSLNQ